MNYKAAPFLFTISALCGNVLANEQETIEQLQQRVDYLEKTLDQRLNSMADAIETSQSETQENRVHIGGYGELHYNNLDADGEDVRTLDLHRMVLFFGYDFNDWARFVSELEVEHAISSSSSRGEVEVEQAYIELDLRKNMHLQTGMILMPIGIINETHEPTTFYGVERPIIETTIIPSTWYSTAINFVHKMDSGLRYDLMLSEGLKTEDPTSSPSADPFDIKGGKQKGSLADAFDLALTGRLKYNGITGLELSAYAQYQPDLDQSAEISYADSATLIGGHIIYQFSTVTAKALYARWDLDGEQAELAGKELQDGGYVELDWRVNEYFGFFIRQSAWTQLEGVDKQQSDFGMNYYPLPNVVFKADVQLQNDDAGNTDGFNLGMGYHF